MEVKDSDKPKICLFCNQSEDNELQYGKFYELDGDIVTHYYCLLLSSNMEQNGGDNDGILGFLREDILKELRRGKRLACSYCRLSGATLGCCMSRCKRVFHLPCGRRAGSLHQFFGQFKSFCASHRPLQKIDASILEQSRNKDATCPICYDAVDPSACNTTLWAPCCRINAWFHRDCVQKLAMSAGYFFKCPLCNNKATFQKAMLDFGIYIPEQDASWELVPNAYQELLHRHNRCDAIRCHCPKGRNHEMAGTRWELVLCKFCGSQGVHIGCGQLKWSNPEWQCDECKLMLKHAQEHQSSDCDDEQEDEAPTVSGIKLESPPAQSRRNRRSGRRRNGRRFRNVLESSSAAMEEDSSSSQGSYPSRASSPVTGPVSPPTPVSVVELSDDDDVVEILDDDNPAGVVNKNIDSGPVVLTSDGKAIPVVQVPRIPLIPDGEDFCVVGDLNVKMPEPQQNSMSGQPQSSRTLVSNSNPPTPQSAVTNSVRLPNNIVPRSQASTINTFRSIVPSSDSQPKPAGLLKVTYSNTASDGDQPIKRIRVSDPLPITSAVSGHMLKNYLSDKSQKQQPKQQQQQQKTVNNAGMSVNNQQQQNVRQTGFMVMNQQKQMVNQTGMVMVNQQQQKQQQQSINRPRILMKNQQQKSGMVRPQQQQQAIGQTGMMVMPQQQGVNQTGMVMMPQQQQVVNQPRMAVMPQQQQVVNQPGMVMMPQQQQTVNQPGIVMMQQEQEAVNQPGVLMMPQQSSPQAAVIRGQTAQPAIMMMMPQQQLAQHSLPVRGQTVTSQPTMMMVQQSPAMCVSSHPNSRWSLPQAAQPQYMVGFVPQQLYQVQPYVQSNFVPIQPRPQVLLQTIPESVIDLTDPEDCHDQRSVGQRSDNRVIPSNLSLGDLRFKLINPSTLQMVLCDNFAIRFGIVTSHNKNNGSNHSSQNMFPQDKVNDKQEGATRSDGIKRRSQSKKRIAPKEYRVHKRRRRSNFYYKNKLSSFINQRERSPSIPKSHPHETSRGRPRISMRHHCLQSIHENAKLSSLNGNQYMQRKHNFVSPLRNKTHFPGKYDAYKQELSDTSRSRTTMNRKLFRNRRARSLSLSRSSQSKNISSFSSAVSGNVSRSRNKRSSSASQSRNTRSRSVSQSRNSRSRSVSQSRNSRSRGVSQSRNTRSSSASQSRNTRSRSVSQSRNTRSRSVSQSRNSRSRSVSQSRNSRSRSVSQSRNMRSSSVSQPRYTRSSSVCQLRNTTFSNVSQPRNTRSRSVSQPRNTRSSSVPRSRYTRSSSVPQSRYTRSRSLSQPRNTRSRSVSQPRNMRSRSVSQPRNTRSRSLSLPRNTRSRSVSQPRNTRSRSVSLPRNTRSRSVSQPRNTRSRSLSQPRNTRSRSMSQPRNTRSRSMSQPRNTSSRSVSQPRNTRSRSVSQPRNTRSRSMSQPRNTRSRSMSQPRNTRSRSMSQPRNTSSRSISQPRNTRSRSVSQLKNTGSRSVSQPRNIRSSSLSRSRNIRSSSVSQPGNTRSSSVSQPRNIRGTVSQSRNTRSSSVSQPGNTRSSSVSQPRNIRSSTVSQSRNTRFSSVSQPRNIRSSTVSQSRNTRSSSVSQPRNRRSSTVSQSRNTRASSVSQPGNTRSSSVSQPRNIRSSTVSQSSNTRSRSTSKSRTISSRIVSQSRNARSVSVPVLRNKMDSISESRNTRDRSVSLSSCGRSRSVSMSRNKIELSGNRSVPTSLITRASTAPVSTNTRSRNTLKFNNTGSSTLWNRSGKRARSSSLPRNKRIRSSPVPRNSNGNSRGNNSRKKRVRSESMEKSKGQNSGKSHELQAVSDKRPRRERETWTLATTDVSLSTMVLTRSKRERRLRSLKGRKRSFSNIIIKPVPSVESLFRRRRSQNKSISQISENTVSETSVSIETNNICSDNQENRGITDNSKFMKNLDEEKKTKSCCTDVNFSVTSKISEISKLVETSRSSNRQRTRSETVPVNIRSVVTCSQSKPILRTKRVKNYSPLFEYPQLTPHSRLLTNTRHVNRNKQAQNTPPQTHTSKSQETGIQSEDLKEASIKERSKSQNSPKSQKCVLENEDLNDSLATQTSVEKVKSKNPLGCEKSMTEKNEMYALTKQTRTGRVRSKSESKSFDSEAQQSCSSDLRNRASAVFEVEAELSFQNGMRKVSDFSLIKERIENNVHKRRTRSFSWSSETQVSILESISLLQRNINDITTVQYKTNVVTSSTNVTKDKEESNSSISKPSEGSSFCVDVNRFLNDMKGSQTEDYIVRMKAKALAARKFRPASRTEDLQRKMMKELQKTSTVTTSKVRDFP